MLQHPPAGDICQSFLQRLYRIPKGYYASFITRATMSVQLEIKKLELDFEYGH